MKTGGVKFLLKQGTREDVIAQSKYNFFPLIIGDDDETKIDGYKLDMNVSSC